MLPNLNIPPLEIFGLELHAFGFLVGTAIVVGTVMAGRRARSFGLSERVVADVCIWAVVVGFVVSHWYSAIFYFPDKIADDPLYLLRIWDGISSFGGFLGGTLGVFLYFRRNKNLPFIPYAECIIYGFAFAWVFGRMGCTVAFDHPGLLTDFPLGMEYQGLWSQELNAWKIEPGVRHNLGMYELVWALILATVFFTQRKKAHFPGWFMFVWIISYIPIRFGWDFLRVADRSWFGLTGGQYAAILLAGLAALLYVKNSKREKLVPDGVPKHLPPAELAALEKQKAGKVGQSKGKKAKTKR